MSKETTEAVRNGANSGSPDHRRWWKLPGHTSDRHEKGREGRGEGGGGDGGRGGEDGGGEGRGDGGRSMARPLFPLSELLQQVLEQEEQLWHRNESLLQSLRVSPATGTSSPVEIEVGGGDRGSVKSLSPENAEEADRGGLYLIRFVSPFGVLSGGS